MKWQCLSTQDSLAWQRVVDRLTHTDIYFLPDYHRAYELNGDGRAVAFVAEAGEHLLFYPFMVRPIERVGSETLAQAWYDIETVYGYSGPLATTTEASFMTEAWGVFADWCQENRIVAEFVRFNPILANQRYADPASPAAQERETVAVRLEGSQEQLWERYPAVQRNMVRKALKKGLVCDELPAAHGLRVFKSIYAETMERLDARAYYHFSAAYFDHLCRALDQRVRFFAVGDDEDVIAAGLFLVADDCVHYHLAGSTLRYREAAPNNLLLHTVALWGQARGLHWLHLGGGRTPDPYDSLFRFKLSVSNTRLPFYTGRRVHNQAAYDMLCAKWLQQQAPGPRPNYFLLYRLESRA